MKYTLEQIAEKIKAIQKSVEEIKSGDLNDSVIHLLISHNTSPKVGVRVVEAVLDSMETLEAKYLKESDD